ncbi:MAG: LytTR family transcriptional regulator DNA-binding domain-containing protein [Lachnospiraceae bacterium]
MQDERYITVTSNRKKIQIGISTILYVIMKRNDAEIHVAGNKIFTVRMTLKKLKEELGDGFLAVHRSCLVSVIAIHDIKDKVYLNNGEALDYVVRKKKALLEELKNKQKMIIGSFGGRDTPETQEDYFRYFRSFDDMPFAFTDIEMVFNEKRHAVDWIFRYGNQALAKLEKLPLQKLIGSSFSSLFENMDSKWLRSYERAALYGEKLEIVDYSPEIDTFLKVICFPTFKGHCGCILFDITDINITGSGVDKTKLPD